MWNVTKILNIQCAIRMCKQLIWLKQAMFDPLVCIIRAYLRSVNQGVHQT